MDSLPLGWARIAVIVALLVATPSAAEAQVVQRWEILPGSTYTYYPSTFGPGISGCEPTNYECAFGIQGRFSLEFANPQNSATFTDLELTLIGNEEIQNNPPGGSPVTADRVEAWLAARLFERVPMASPIDFYQDSVFASLLLTDYIDSIVELSGGYDLTPIDGDGLNFHVTARLIPEPNTFLLLSIGFAALGFRRC